MLSYDDALSHILAQVSGPLPAETVPLTLALGRALAEDLVADSDLPPFDNSAVDGYALDGSTVLPGTEGNLYKQAFAVRTGRAPAVAVPPGACARIFTGAMVPDGCDRIVMQEDVEVQAGGDIHVREPGNRGDFIRRRGSDVKAGTCVCKAGQPVHPGVIGLLASLNRTTVAVPRQPRVALLTTGDELVPNGGRELKPGEIRDSNGPALTAAIAEAGGLICQQHHVPDTAEATRAAFDACSDCDVLVTSGGVSVGDRDFIQMVAKERGALDFWKVAIRPGKPLAFGRIGHCLFFGLPGNPVSSLVTFELFVRPTLRKLSGHHDLLRPQVVATLTAPLSHEPGRREFARAAVRWEHGHCLASPTGAQGSHRLSSLLSANAYLIADENHGDYATGDSLPALLLL
jgi:molybdopterin molybdotransferase